MGDVSVLGAGPVARGGARLYAPPPPRILPFPRLGLRQAVGAVGIQNGRRNVLLSRGALSGVLRGLNEIIHVKVVSPGPAIEQSLNKYYFYHSANVEKELSLRLKRHEFQSPALLLINCVILDKSFPIPHFQLL